MSMGGLIVSSCQPCPSLVWTCLMGLCDCAKNRPFIVLHQPGLESVLAGAYSKVRITAVLTGNGAFVSLCVLELVSKPHIPSTPSHRRFFFFSLSGRYKTKQRERLWVPPQGLVAWSAEARWPSYSNQRCAFGLPKAFNLTPSSRLTVPIDKMSRPSHPDGACG